MPCSDRIIKISDDFDPEKISLSGQCFRVKKSEAGSYRFICRDKVLYLKEIKEHEFSVSCSLEEWENVWATYFDLGRNYQSLCERVRGKDPFVDRALAFGRGLRVLRQDPWETLLSFIISQRKNIPAISKSVETLSEKFGRRVQTEYEEVYLFPSPEELAAATEQDFLDCGAGYRAAYLLDAVLRVLAHDPDPDALEAFDDAQLLDELRKIKGVGIKVANCVALFAYGRTGCVPVDVWISRAIRQDCEGKSPFPLYGDNAGIIQQYVFFYERFRNQS